MSELKAKLLEYGADVAGIKERFMDDAELYMQCVEMFRGDPNFENLGKALEQKDYKAAFDCAHTLKGVSGNLGLTPMYNTICKIVEPLRAEDYSDVDNQYKAVVEARDKFFSII